MDLIGWFWTAAAFRRDRISYASSKPVRLWYRRRTMRVRRTGTRGFTMTEMVVAMAIATILGAVTYAGVRAMSDGRQLEAGANNVLASVRRARSLGVTGQAFQVNIAPPPPSPPPGGPAPAVAPVLDLEPIRLSGIQIIDSTSLRVFTLSRAGTDTTIEVLALRTLYPAAELQIVAPTPSTQILFRRNGTRDLTTPGRITLQDMRSGRQQFIDINGAGIPILGP